MIVIIKEKTVGIVERLGKFSRILHPGIHMYIPLVEEVVAIFTTKISSLVLEVETKTIDNCTVKVILAIQYQIILQKAYNAYYDFVDYKSQIKSYVYDVVRAVVPKMTIDELFYKKEELAHHVLEDLYNTMCLHGFDIKKTLVIDIHPDERVRTSMNDFNIAQRQKNTAAEQAEAVKILQVKKAEAEYESLVLHGKGIAGQRDEIMKGFSKIFDSFNKQSNLDDTTLISMIVSFYYMDTMKEIGTKSQQSFINAQLKGDSFNDLMGTIRSAITSANKAKTENKTKDLKDSGKTENNKNKIEKKDNK